MKLKRFAAGVGVALSVAAGSAVALPISGTASVTGFFDTYSASGSAIVSDLNSIDVSAAALVGGTTGDFSPNGFATATDFTIVPVTPGLIYTFNGFTFNVSSISNIDRGALGCDATGCTDSLGFDIGGMVSKAGFDDTVFTGVWTGNGSCQQGAPLTCLAGSKSGSWSVSVTAIGQSVPEPGSLALMGLGLLALGTLRRRAQ